MWAYPARPPFCSPRLAVGDLMLYQVGFTDSTNVFSVTSGTLQIFHWNELNSPSPSTLAVNIDPDHNHTAIDHGRAAGRSIRRSAH